MGADGSSLGGELECVSDEVDEHLIQPIRVAHYEDGHIGSIERQRQPLALGTVREGVDDPSEQIAQVYRLAFDLERPRLQAREDEHLIGKPKQALSISVRQQDLFVGFRAERL